MCYFLVVQVIDSPLLQPTTSLWSYFWIELFHVTRMARYDGYGSKYWLRYMYSRFSAHYILFPSWWDLPYILPYIGFPLLMSWYLYDPYLMIKMPNSTQTARFDYCVERFPLYGILGVLPALAYLSQIPILLHLCGLLLLWTVTPEGCVPKGCSAHQVDPVGWIEGQIHRSESLDFVRRN